MTAINLGIPEGPPPVLAPRRKTRKITLKHHSHPLEVGGDAPISVQSMCTTLTADVNSTLQPENSQCSLRICSKKLSETIPMRLLMPP